MKFSFEEYCEIWKLFEVDYILYGCQKDMEFTFSYDDVLKDIENSVDYSDDSICIASFLYNSELEIKNKHKTKKLENFVFHADYDGKTATFYLKHNEK